MSKRNQRYEYGKTEIKRGLKALGLQLIRCQYEGKNAWYVEGKYYYSLAQIAFIYLAPKKHVPQAIPAIKLSAQNQKAETESQDAN